MCSRCPFVAAPPQTVALAYATGALPVLCRWAIVAAAADCDAGGRQGEGERPRAETAEALPRSGDDRGPKQRADPGHHRLLVRRYEDRLARSEQVFPRSYGARRAQQDLRRRAGEVAGRRAVGEEEPGQPELVDGCLVDLLAVGRGLRAEDPGVARREADDPQQLGDVDVLGGQS